MLKRGRRKVGRRVKVVERKLPGRMWHEWKVLLMSINDIRKAQPNMPREGTAKTGCNGCGRLSEVEDLVGLQHGA